MDESDWEDGSTHSSKYRENGSGPFINGITVELNPSQDFVERKTKRRASAEDKVIYSFLLEPDTYSLTCQMSSNIHFL